jgi:hypothetical protein
MGAKWYDIYLRELFVAKVTPASNLLASLLHESQRHPAQRSIHPFVGRSALCAGARRSRVRDRSIGCAVQAWCIRYAACSGCPAVPTDSAIYPTRHVPARSGRAHCCRCSAPDAPQPWLNPPLCSAPSTALHQSCFPASRRRCRCDGRRDAPCELVRRARCGCAVADAH